MSKLEKRARGELTVRELTSETEKPELVVILCHGFGAPGTDLVGLAEFLHASYSSAAERAHFVFPEAPLTLGEYGMPEGRAWWPLDMERMQRAAERGEFRDLRQDRPADLTARRDALLAVISELSEELGVSANRFVLGGFSQGSMLAVETALHLDENPAALVVYSGTLLSENEWTERMPHREGTTVLQSHGREDPILPFEAASWLRDLMQNSGLNVQWIPFDGPHTIAPESLHATGGLLTSLLAD